MQERQQITCIGSFIPPFFELLEFPECNVCKFVKEKKIKKIASICLQEGE
jgi:hypothetical protein